MTVTPGHTYVYRVRAANALGNSGASNTASVIDAREGGGALDVRRVAPGRARRGRRRHHRRQAVPRRRGQQPDVRLRHRVEHLDRRPRRPAARRRPPRRRGDQRQALPLRRVQRRLAGQRADLRPRDQRAGRSARHAVRRRLRVQRADRRQGLRRRRDRRTSSPTSAGRPPPRPPSTTRRPTRGSRSRRCPAASTTPPPPPTARSSTSSAAATAAGGVLNGFDTVQVYDPATNTWRPATTPAPASPRCPTPAAARARPSSPTASSSSWAARPQDGPGATADNVFDRVDVYNPDDQHLAPLRPMPTPRHGIFPLLHGNRILVAAGGTRAGGQQVARDGDLGTRGDVTGLPRTSKRK